MSNNLFINFSEKPKGKTSEVALSLSEELGGNVIYAPTFKTCLGCGFKDCSLNKCVLSDAKQCDTFTSILKEESIQNIYFCFPVYLNMPTPKLMSFLSRLASPNDQGNRLMFSNKNAYIVPIADVSGTQSSASSVMLALNMLGFNLPSRCVYEHINNWQDNKIRGGNKYKVLKYKSKDNEFKTKSESE